MQIVGGIEKKDFGYIMYLWSNIENLDIDPSYTAILYQHRQIMILSVDAWNMVHYSWPHQLTFIYTYIVACCIFENKT